MSEELREEQKNGKGLQNEKPVVTMDDLEKKGTIIPDVGEISPEEAKQLAALRQAKTKRQECANEIDAILKKHNALLVINPNSPFGSPQIIVQLR